VLWWNGGALEFGLVAGEDKGRARVLPVRGREERIRSSRVALELHPGAAPGARGPSGAEALAEFERRVRAAAERVDVRMVWEIVVEGRAPDVPGAEASLEELSGLAFARPTDEAQAATLLALLADGLHFTRRPAGWLPRTREAVEALLQEREAVAQREAQRHELFATLAAVAAGGEFRPRGHELERRYLDALEQLAVRDVEAADSARELALEALAASRLRYLRPHEGAFRLLRRLGRFAGDDENLQPLRFGLRTAFPAPVLDLARARARAPLDRGARADLTGLEAVSIDGPFTRDIDDLLSVEPRGEDGLRLGVHIADPAAFVEPGDALDAEAGARGLSHYMPDLRIPMLPAEIAEQAASLAAGAERPALSFLIDLSAAGEVVGFTVQRAVVRSAARLTYADGDAVLAQGSGAFHDLLGRLARIATLRREARTRAGAVAFQAPEVDLHVLEDGTIAVERLPAESLSRAAVSEAMILAGDVAARWCQRSGVPAIFRRQAPPAELPEAWRAGARDAATLRRVRRSLRRAEVSLTAGPHAGLGLAAYVQVSSPLRRYQDLVLHRQILGVLGGGGPCYGSEALARIAAATEAAEADARRAEQAADEYWMLRYLEQQAGCELEAVVVELKPRPTVQLVQVLHECALPGLAGVREGQVIVVRVEQVEPRAGVLVLRRVDQESRGGAS